MLQSRKLDDLDPRLRTIIFEFLARLTEAKKQVLIINTLRDLEKQKENLKNKVSWTLNSKHLPQPPHNLSLAIDICPYSIWDANGPDKLNWNEEHPDWQIIGHIGMSLGLKWGLLRADGTRYDLGHFEYKGD